METESLMEASMKLRDKASKHGTICKFINHYNIKGNICHWDEIIYNKVVLMNSEFLDWINNILSRNNINFPEICYFFSKLLYVFTICSIPLDLYQEEQFPELRKMQANIRELIINTQNDLKRQILKESSLELKEANMDPQKFFCNEDNSIGSISESTKQLSLENESRENTILEEEDSRMETDSEVEAFSNSAQVEADNYSQTTHNVASSILPNANKLTFNQNYQSNAFNNSNHFDNQSDALPKIKHDQYLYYTDLFNNGLHNSFYEDNHFS
jgi:hypothetical protein